MCYQPDVVSMLNQITIEKSIGTVGIGLHSGTKVHLVFHPAPTGTGIVFRRTDADPVGQIPCSANAVGDTRMASTIQNGQLKISTVEHLLAACSALGISNLYIDVSAEEVPIMDGSAMPFLLLLKEAGLRVQNEPKKFLRVMQEVTVHDGVNHMEKWARLSPHHGYKMRFSIDFDHPFIDATPQVVDVDFNMSSFTQAISRARTFGFMRDVETLRGMGLARGGSFETAIVLDEYTILNDAALRYEGEFARHKILDAVGDLYLAGYPLLAGYEAHKAGHGLNNQLLRALFADPTNYEVVTLTQEQAPAVYADLLKKEWQHW